jgi:hypothetical protein
MSGEFFDMMGPSSSAGDPSRLVSQEGFADRLLRRAEGSPGLVDAAAAQAEVAYRIDWLDRLTPILRRLLARAAEGEADGLAGSAPPLATPFAFHLGELPTPQPLIPAASRLRDFPAPPLTVPSASHSDDPLVSPRLARRAGEAPAPSPPSTDSPQHLVRIRRAGPAGAAPNRLGAAPTEPGARPGAAAIRPGATATQPGDGAGTVAAGQSPLPATAREISAVATTPSTVLHVAQAPRPEQGVAAPAIVGTAPAPRSGPLPPPDANRHRGSPAVSQIGSSNGDPRPSGAPIDAVPSVREL